MNFIRPYSGKSIAADREQAIERILTYLSLSELWDDWRYIPEHAGALRAYNALPLTHFNGAQPMTDYSLLFATKSYTRAVLDYTDPELRDLPMSDAVWNVSMLAVADSGAESAKRIGKTYLYTLCKVRRVPLREMRGKLSRFRSGLLVEYSLAEVYNDGTYRASRAVMERVSGNQWLKVYAGVPLVGEPLEEDEVESIWQSKALALTSEYDWQAKISYSAGQLPSIALAIDPISAKDIFKLRDAPLYKSRRDALLHWVSEHWRSAPSGSELDPIEILPYLRGATVFHWNGMDVEIKPSAHDLRRAERFKAQTSKKR